MSAPDRIELRGLRCRGYHGVYDHERTTGQVFVVDAVLHVDARQAAASDALTDTVDYGALAKRLAEVVEGEPVDLLERLAERLAAVCLDDQLVAAAEVTVHKPEAPIDLPFTDVAVTVVRPAEPRRRRAVLALGSNVGDRLGWLRRGLRLLGAHDAVEVTGVSPVYETAPVGGPADQPAYLNAVATVELAMDAADLLGLLHVVEAACERTRDVRWGPRTLDLDIVSFEGVESSQPELTLPHPRAHERGFVLVPWLDVEPAATVTGHGAVADLVRRVDTGGVVRRDDLALEVPS